jgi:hypothetical protein
MEKDMPAVMIALNILFVVFVVAVLFAAHFWAMATQHHDHGVTASGSLLRRHVWSRRGRRHAGPVRPWIARRGEVWPAA